MRSNERRAEVHDVLAPFLGRLEQKDDVEGIVFLSSVTGRNTGRPFDVASDIDLAFFLSREEPATPWRPCGKRGAGDGTAPTWCPNFSFRVPTSWGCVEVNVSQEILELEEDPRTEWTEDKRDTYQRTSEVVFDRRGRIARLLAWRTTYSDEERQTKVAQLAGRLEWDIRVLPMRQAARGELAGAHYLVHFAVEELIELVFALAGRFVPNRRWRLRELARSALLDPEELEAITASLTADASSRGDLERRIELAEWLWTRIRERAGASIAAAPFDRLTGHWSFDRQLRTRTIADEALALFGEDLGPDVHGISNLLLPDSLTDLAQVADDDLERLPASWIATARELRTRARSAVAVNADVR